MTMTQIGSKTKPGGRSNLLFAFAAVLVALIIAAVYSSSAGGRSQAHQQQSKPQSDVAARSAMENESSGGTSGGATDSAGISEGSVAIPVRSSELDANLPYLHCGPRHAGGSGRPELILLHGAAFTKEDWRTSGILSKLCERSGGTLSATALDLHVKSDGLRLADTFETLRKEGVISGDPATFVSPSASGKAMVHLGEMAAAGSDENDGTGSGLLKRLVKAWIPVACFAVLGAAETSIQAYPKAGIPILAMHGTEDKRGKDVTKRLVELVGATGLELKGRHPCYLDSPDDFVSHVLKFVGVTDIEK